MLNKKLSTFASLSINSAKSVLGGLIWVLIAGLAVVIGCVQTQEIENQSENLQVTIKSDKKVYELNDKLIILVLTMKNIGGDDVKPYYILNDSFLVVNGKEIALADWIIWRGNIEGCLPPGTEFSHSMNIIKVCAIDKVGQYSLVWKYKTIISNTITIEISK